MRLHRLLGIIMLLDSRGIMKAGSLAKILETSERTIYRDIDILCEAGIPITSIPGPSGGYTFMENYKVNSNLLAGDSIVTLLLTSMGIRPEKNSEMDQALKNAVIMLENSLSEEHREEIIKAKERFFIDSDPWWGRRTVSPDIDTIKKAVLDQKKLKITYKKYAGESSERIIRPYGAIVKDSQWYMAAFCEERQAERIFKCSRIIGMEVLEEGFSMPENFSLEDFWEKSKAQFIQRASSRRVSSLYPVVVKFHADKKGLLEGFNIIESPESEDEAIYTIDMISLETACTMIYAVSDVIEVLQPEELRNYIIEKTMKVLQIYKKIE
ncbi:helix-turn-helix transcriptional regulator [Clostridium thermarum]|uniref:helix-turn-helix transcriptional regulator n=1 Tax=Clostridium thermarum TaxID=1716543 RepID=UPI0013D5C2CC|nr:YafY family protein [Clostridium thermarum]